MQKQVLPKTRLKLERIQRPGITIIPEAWPSTRAIFNPAACVDTKGVVHVFPRVIDWGRYADPSHPNPAQRDISYLSRLGHFQIKNWAIENEQCDRLEDPIIKYDSSLSDNITAQLKEWQHNGVEDPRIVYDEQESQWYMTMVFLRKPAFSPAQQATTVISVSRDLHTFNVIGIATPSEIVKDADDRDGVPFPSRINGKRYMLQRPQKDITIIKGGKTISLGYHAYGSTSKKLSSPVIRLAIAKDFMHLFKGKVLIDYENPWESTELGAGPPPIETPQGWLLFYNCVEMVGDMDEYRVGTALLSKDASKVIGRLPYPLLWPEDSDEIHGDAHDHVVFATGAFIDPVDSDKVVVVYGGGDRVVKFASCSLSALIAALVANPSRPQTKHWLK